MNPETRARRGIALLTATVLLSALLLFGMEPLVGRLLVPWFGGAVHVWLTCLMFYQAMLLVGYSYAHLLARRMGRWHLALLLLPLLNLPLAVYAEVDPQAPMGALLGVLFLRVALPFVVLSTTAVVMQTWFAWSEVGRHREPYMLYAASNVGSLVALLGYPFVVEPLFGLRMQSLLWSLAYPVYALLVVACWYVVRPELSAPAQAAQPVSTGAAPPTAADYLGWLVLSALPSGFLLAITNVVAADLGSFPMVWVLPLALYLGSFVITFRDGGGVPRLAGTYWPELVVLGAMLYAVSETLNWVAFVDHHLTLFGLCLVAHGEIYARRPHPRYLTHLYLTMAVGGWVGGAAVSLVAPLVFPGLYEYPFLLAGLGVTLLWVRGGELRRFFREAGGLVRSMRGGVFAIAGTLVVVMAFLQPVWLERHRSFYGVYRVGSLPDSAQTPGGARRLIHGTTVHGIQLADPDKKHLPTAYYGRPVGPILERLARPRRIGIVGLGIGVVATWAEPGDILDYYEIDPDNEAIARRWFSYLDDSRGDVRVFVGDGRLAMEDPIRGRGPYDVLQLDAFSGDGIPTHLLTEEALETYLGVLAEDGVLMFHLSNRYYDLRPVVKQNALRHQLHGAYLLPSEAGALPPWELPSVWMLLSRDPARLEGLGVGWVPLGREDGLADITPWTDDYVDVLTPLLLAWSQQAQ